MDPIGKSQPQHLTQESNIHAGNNASSNKSNKKEPSQEEIELLFNTIKLFHESNCNQNKSLDNVSVLNGNMNILSNTDTKITNLDQTITHNIPSNDEITSFKVGEKDNSTNALGKNTFAFKGRLQNGKPHQGTGVFSFSGGYTFLGEIINGHLYNGNGTFIAAGGSIFEGEVKKGKPYNGKVTWRTKKGITLSCEFKDGFPYNGYGKWKISDKNYYTGEIKKGFPYNGRGKVTFHNNSVFDGEFKFGHPYTGSTCDTKLVFADGTWFCGDLKDGRPVNGTGRLRFCEGYMFNEHLLAEHIYDGEWKEGKRYGSGRLVTKDYIEWEVTYDDQGVLTDSKIKLPVTQPESNNNQNSLKRNVNGEPVNNTDDTEEKLNIEFNITDQINFFEEDNNPIDFYQMNLGTDDNFWR